MLEKALLNSIEFGTDLLSSADLMKFRTILSYLGSKAVIKFQALSKVFYEKHVPKVMDSIHSYAFMSSLLNSRHFSQSPKFTLLYVGSQHEFKSRMFHELCDNRGPTISVVRTEFNHTFGFYTSVAWESSGNYKLIPNARTFMFKLLKTKLGAMGEIIKMKLEEEKVVLEVKIAVLLKTKLEDVRRPWVSNKTKLGAMGGSSNSAAEMKKVMFCGFGIVFSQTFGLIVDKLIEH